MRVLVIEDDREMAEAIGVGLRRSEMAVDIAYDGESGWQRSLIADYDVIVLDRDPPVSTATRYVRACSGAARAPRS
jgi:DNA-binding response OmpR family regulator